MVPPQRYTSTALKMLPTWAALFLSCKQCSSVQTDGLAEPTGFAFPAAPLLHNTLNTTSLKVDALTVNEARDTGACVVQWEQGNGWRYRDNWRSFDNAARATRPPYLVGLIVAAALCCVACAAHTLMGYARAKRRVRWRDKLLSGSAWVLRIGDFASNGLLVALNANAIARAFTRVRLTLSAAPSGVLTSAIPLECRVALDALVAVCDVHCLGELVHAFVRRSDRSTQDVSYRSLHLTSKWWGCMVLAISCSALSTAWAYIAMKAWWRPDDGSWLLSVILQYAAMQATKIMIRRTASSIPVPSSPPPPTPPLPSYSPASAPPSPPCPCGSLLDWPVPVGLPAPLTPGCQQEGKCGRRAYRTECYSCAISER